MVYITRTIVFYYSLIIVCLAKVETGKDNLVKISGETCPKDWNGVYCAWEISQYYKAAIKTVAEYNLENPNSILKCDNGLHSLLKICKSNETCNAIESERICQLHNVTLGVKPTSKNSRTNLILIFIDYESYNVF